MSRGPQVQGFDYVTGKAVAMTPAEWRAKYPPDKYVRATAKDRYGNPETWYRWYDRSHTSGVSNRRISAEAYAIIPAGKAVASGR